MAIGCSGDDTEVTEPVDTGTPDTGLIDTGTDTGSMPIDTGTDTGVVPTEFTATPKFEPPGGSFTAPVDVKITSTTPGAVIYYTTDGTPPNTSSTKYATPINIAATTTIKAMALAPGFIQSEVATATYTITPTPTDTVQSVTFTPPGGPYENDQTIALASATPAATICYTTDGTSTPTCDATTAACTGSSATYSAGSPIPVTSTGKKIQAMACKVGMKPSAVTSATYTLNAASAVFSPAAGTYDAPGITVTATLATAGATVRYTTNGTDPNCTSIGSTFDFTGVSIRSNTVFKAITCKAGYNPSAVQTINYNIRTRPVTATPVAGDVNNDVSIDLAQATEGTGGPGSSVICWSTGADPACGGGATPSCSAGTAWSTTARPLVNKDTTVKAIACDANRVPGTVQSFVYTTRVAPLTFNPVSGTKYAALPANVEVTTATTGVTMRYTTNGTTTPDCTTTGTPIAGCTTVSGGTGTSCNIPFAAITQDKELRVIACKTNYASATGSATYTSATAIPTPVITPGATAGTLNNITHPTIAAGTGSPAGTWFCFTVSGLIPGFPPADPVCVAPGGATTPTVPTSDATACTTGTWYVGPTSTAPSNVTINANGQSIKAVACPALTTSSASAIKTESGYTFKTATPTLTPASGAIGANAPIEVRTTTVEEGNNVTFHYTAGATTPADPTCASSGSSATAGSVNAANDPATGTATSAVGQLPGAVTNTTGTITVKVVACKDNYLISDVVTTTYAPRTADPTLNPSPNSSNVITVFPASGVDLTSVSGTGTKICYTWDGGVPTCSALLVCGTSGDATKMNSGEIGGPGSLNIPATVFSNDATTPPNSPKSGVVVNAIACRTGLANSAVTSRTFNFNTSLVDFNPTANEWNATTTYASNAVVTSGGFFYKNTSGAAATGKPVTDKTVWTEQATGSVTMSFNASTGTGGTTIGNGTAASRLALCYRTDGAAPSFQPVTTSPSQPDPCLPLDANTICSYSNSATPAPVTLNISRIETVIAVGCKKGFINSVNSVTLNVTPYRHTIDMTLASSDFTDATEHLTSTSGADVYVTIDSSNLYLGYRGNGASSVDPDSAIGWYILAPGASTATSASTGFAGPATGTANYFLRFSPATNTTTLRFWNGTSWVDAPATGITSKTSGAAITSFAKMGIPFSTIGVTATTPFRLAGEVILSAANSTTPNGGSYILVDPRSSLAPNDASKIIP